MGDGERPLVIVRADGGLKLGHGHVRRCLNVAKFLRDEGFYVVFVLRDSDSGLLSLVRHSRFEIIELSARSDPGVHAFVSDVGEKEFTGMVQDAEKTAQMVACHLPGRSVSWVITDHLCIRSPWQAAFRALTQCRVLAIDGQANYAHDADILIDPQLSDAPLEKWQTLIPDNCRIFSGPAYIPLSGPFTAARNTAAVRSHPISRILICFGGSEIQSVVVRTVRLVSDWLALRYQRGITVDVVIPETAPCRDEVVQGFGRHPQLTVHSGIDDLAQLMLGASLAIGGGGIMMWERCLLGLPAIVVPLAPNQADPIRKIAEKGGVLALRSLDQTYEQDLRVALDEIADDPAVLETLSNNAFAVMNGWPATRGWLDLMKSLSNE